MIPMIFAVRSFDDDDDGGLLVIVVIIMEATKTCTR